MSNIYYGVHVTNGGVIGRPEFRQFDKADVFYAQAIAYQWGMEDSDNELVKQVRHWNSVNEPNGVDTWRDAWRAESGYEDRLSISDAYKLYAKYGYIRCRPPMCRVAHLADKPCKP
jgi:hypothetical protein